MKLKHISIITFTILMVFAFSPQVFAAAGSGAIDFGGGATYDLSNKVWIEYDVDDTSNPQEFGVGTVHAAGDREYQTSDASSVIWWKTVDKGTVDPTTPVAGMTYQEFVDASWNSL